RRLWGVGEKTAEVLERLPLRGVGGPPPPPRPGGARGLRALVARGLPAHPPRGRDERGVTRYEGPKSVGHEETFERDLDDTEEISRELLHLSGRVAARLRDDGYRARTVTLKVRLAQLPSPTRSH